MNTSLPNKTSGAARNARLVCISDTHGHHRQLRIPEGDILLHAGDLVARSNLDEIRDFLEWFAAQSHEHKIFIAGNHDRMFEQEPEMIASLIPKSVTYLQDSGCILKGLKFWGSPVQPWFYNWAFNRQRGREINAHWNMIPGDADVVITHGPARGILDQDHWGGNLGCADLRKHLERVQPRLHLCGHIHGGYGRTALGRTCMVNAAVCDDAYRPVNAPIIVSL